MSENTNRTMPFYQIHGSCSESTDADSTSEPTLNSIHQSKWLTLIRFSSFYKFGKPNDERALRLMNESALKVMGQITDVVLAYGQSDEYSFVLQKSCSLFDRRES